ncbi:MAG: F0F1 ATP synthase subunit gamma [Gammaproteobacteria bacterium]
MTDSTSGLRRKIDSAGDLQSVVRTMKALAASNISQYEKSVRALGDYYRTVELGLAACFRGGGPANTGTLPKAPTGKVAVVDAIVFGSDQGLVGRFNEIAADYAVKELAVHTGQVRIWAIGERVRARLADAGLPPHGLFAVPNSVNAIAPLVGRILVECGASHGGSEPRELYLFYNRTASRAGYEPVGERLLPLDENWRRGLAALQWPTASLPEAIGDRTATVQALLGEYLFISLFRACAESLASENASRLAAMQRADQNIDGLLEQLRGTFQRVRQASIDEELFDVISGFEALLGSGGVATKSSATS